MQTETIDAQQGLSETLYASLQARHTTYKNALQGGNSILINAARLLLQNTLNSCSLYLNRTTTRPAGWPYPLYPNVLDGDPIELEFRAS